MYLVLWPEICFWLLLLRCSWASRFWTCFKPVSSKLLTWKRKMSVEQNSREKFSKSFPVGTWTAGLNYLLPVLLFHHYPLLFLESRLYLVGSSLNGFGTRSSDADLCLVIKEEPVSTCAQLSLYRMWNYQLQFSFSWVKGTLFLSVIFFFFF